MNAERWQRLRELFDAALAREPSLREALLVEVEPDAVLRGEVLALLAADGRTQDGVCSAVQGAIATTLSPAPAGMRLGAYRLVEELGSGGMGTVFLAERADDSFHHRVAIKLLRGVPTREGADRMRRERQILADLNHPNIARLLDGGNTADGQPYLVMEYVEGASLLGWCNEHSLDRAARLRLFVCLCGAVEHAHRHLIVHRDIKPDNVRVRADGEPVLLDFGIARLLDDGADASGATRVFTPAYAAPEQRGGSVATTVTDVYGLGCVLFDLLTGGAIARAQAGTGPLSPPSACVADVVTARALRGDLDTLVMKAIHAEPSRRYDSARALADDVENYLAGRPLRAAPDSFVYRLRKTLVRHRYAAAAAAVVAVAATLFVWRLDAERQRALDAEARAEREAASARHSRDYLVSMFKEASPDASLGRALSARELIDRGRARLAHELKDEPVATARLLLTIAGVYAALGDPRAAAANAEEALQHAEGEGAEPALLRAEILDALGSAYLGLDRAEDARKAAQQSFALRAHHVPNDHALLAASLNGLGQAALRAGDHAEAKTRLEQALAALERTPSADPAGIGDVLQALAYDALGESDAVAALAYAERGLAALAALPPDHPARLELWRAQAQAYRGLGQPSAATDVLGGALQKLRPVAGERSTVVAHLENDLATALNDQGRYREAVVHLENAVAILAELRPDDAVALAIPKTNLGNLYLDVGNYAAAESLMREALEATERATPDDHERIDPLRANLASALSRNGKAESARALMREVLASTRERHGADSLNYALVAYQSARVEQRAGAIDEADQHLREAAALIETKLPPAHPLRPLALRLRGLIERDRGDLAAARRDLQAAAAAQAALEAGDRNTWAEIEIDLADVLVRQDDRSAAQRHLQAALAVFERSLPVDAPPLLDVKRRLRELAQAG